MKVASDVPGSCGGSVGDGATILNWFGGGSGCDGGVGDDGVSGWDDGDSGRGYGRNDRSCGECDHGRSINDMH